VQKKMFGEARALLPDYHTPVTDRVLERAVYAKAVVKEMFRMNPISVGIGRILPEECVFSGYKVPAGVNATDNIKQHNIIIKDVTTLLHTFECVAKIRKVFPRDFSSNNRAFSRSSLGKQFKFSFFF